MFLLGSPPFELRRNARGKDSQQGLQIVAVFQGLRIHHDK